MEEKTYINICKAFSDNNRMKIFEMLRKQDMCAYEILKNLNCSQPTLSYHMKLLTDSGVVNGEKRGLWRRLPQRLKKKDIRPPENRREGSGTPFSPTT